MKFFLDEKGLEHFTGKLKSKFVEIETNADSRLDALELARAKGKDWSQNDETADDYIKGRTHWEEIKETEIVPLTTVSAETEGMLAESELLIEGTTYKVLWNGVEYIRKAQNLSIDLDGTGDLMTLVYVGNTGFFGGIPTDGDPFIVVNTQGITLCMDAPMMESGASATVAISTREETVHKLDNKFVNLPCYEVAGLQNIFSGEMQDPTEVSGTVYQGSLSSVVELEEGETYNLTVFGTKYEGLVCTAANTDGFDMLHIGNISLRDSTYNDTTGVPVLVSTVPGYASILTIDVAAIGEPASLAVSIDKAAMIVVQLDEKFIPDTIARVEDIPEIPDVSGAISTHNNSTTAHSDIRNLIAGLTNRLNALADSDDTTLDQLSEIVEYIKSNKGLIDSITTSKVNVTDIVDNLTTNVTTKPLSAAQGVAIKALITALQTAVNALPTFDNLNTKMNASNPVGTGSFSMGRKADTTVGYNSFAVGNDVEASNSYSHAEGWGTTASDFGSHAEGRDTTASGEYSHAEGRDTTASDDYSHAEGWYTTASGYVSHAEGYNTTASGEYSHAEGRTTTASGDCQHVQGKYNIDDAEGKYAHIVGNGTGTNNRKNAHTLDWDGNAWFAGSLYVGGTGQDDAAAVNVALERIVVTEGTGAAFTATVPGIPALTAGVSFIMIPHTVSTSTSPTLDVNGLGAIKMYRRLSSNLTSVQVGYNAAWIAANKPIEVMYDGSFWIVMGQEKPSTADLSGTLAINKGGTGATTAEDALANLLPAVTAADAGKTLRVSADGKWVLSD